MKKTVVYLLFFFLSSCSKNLIINSNDYKDTHINIKSLIVQFLPSEIKINDELTEKITTSGFLGDSSFYSFIANTLKLSIKEILKLDEIYFTNKINNYNKKIFEINGEQIELSYQKSKELVELNQFILLLEDFNYAYQQNSQFLPLPNFLLFLNNTDELILESKFLLWDNGSEKIVSYGKLKIITNSHQNKIKEDIKVSLKKLINEIFNTDINFK